MWSKSEQHLKYKVLFAFFIEWIILRKQMVSVDEYERKAARTCGRNG